VLASSGVAETDCGRAAARRYPVRVADVDTTTSVRAWRRPLPGRWTPAQVLRALRHDDRPVALVGPGWGGAVLGSEPTAVADPDDDLFALLGRGTVGADAGGPVAAAAGVRVGGAWIGYLGYQLNRRVERLPPAPTPAPPLPDGALAWYDHVLCQAPDGRWWFEALAGPDRRRALDQRYRLLAARLGRPPPAPVPYRGAPFHLVPGGTAHRDAIRAAVEYIRAGDIYQANVCLRAESHLDGDPLDLFCTGVEALAPAYGAFARLPEGAVCSFSPELFLALRGRQVRTGPIKGTAPRSPAPADAEAQRRALEASPKDRAENVMIVDLMRNDLGRVCVPGTVHVPRLARAEAHPGLWHLVSEVVGELRPTAGAGDLLRAAFPPGSCTGAPKVRAMQRINELEATARGAYTGAAGLAGPLAGLTLNVAIRTVEWSSTTGALTLGVGGGIVADSDADAELAECLTKATPIVTAVGARPAPPR
jgi:para-aminobenzoate synthetase / 4-amino-4-deoxychorismate lyase